MRRADRLIELANHLRPGHLITADVLATRLEVSVRTVYRDIAALQAQGFAIEGAAGLGYALRAPIHLPALTFDHDQLEALALGLAYVMQVGDEALTAAARAALNKIDRQWNPTDIAHRVAFDRLRSYQANIRRAPRFASSLRLALRKRRLIRFDYVNAAGEQSARTVRPLALTVFSEGWLLIGWCALREDFRVFRLDRLSSLQLLETDFEDEQGRDLASYIAVRGPANRAYRPHP